MVRRFGFVLVGLLVAGVGTAVAQVPEGQPPADELPTVYVEEEPAPGQVQEGEPEAAEAQAAVEATATEGATEAETAAEAETATEAETGTETETATETETRAETGTETATEAETGGEGEGEGEAAGEVIDNAGDEVPGDMTAEQAQADPAQYAAHLREVIKAVKKSVMAKVAKQMAARQEAKLGRIFTVLFFVSFGGFLLLLLPLFLARRYPGKGGLLFKYSGMAALTAFVAINLFAGVLLFLRTAQGELSSFTNPKLAIMSSSFDTFEELAADESQQETIAMLGPSFIEPLLEKYGGEEAADLPVALMETMMESPLAANIQELNNDVAVFRSLAGVFESLSWVFSMIPVALTLLAVVLFLLAIRPTLMEIVQMPARAAQGQQGLGGQMFRLVFSRVTRELLATLCLLGVLFAVVMLSSALLYQTIRPAVEALLAYVFVAFAYLMAKQDASSALVITSLVMVMLFLVLNLAVMILGSAVFLGKSQKIFQQRFQDRIPLRAHRRFWTWGVAAILWVQVFPLLFILAAKPGLEWIIGRFMGQGEDPSWGLVMAVVPLTMVVGFAVLFWAVRGLKGLRFLLAYKPKEVGAQHAAAAQAGFLQPAFVPPPPPAYGYLPPPAPGYGQPQPPYPPFPGPFPPPPGAPPPARS